MMNEFEVNFDHWNILWKKYENRYDKFTAESIEDAKALARWKYGDCIDIISVEILK